jgi:hypothetical protein
MGRIQNPSQMASHSVGPRRLGQAAPPATCDVWPLCQVLDGRDGGASRAKLGTQMAQDEDRHKLVVALGSSDNAESGGHVVARRWARSLAVLDARLVS